MSERILYRHNPSGEVFITDGFGQSEPLHHSEWQTEEGAVRDDLDLFDYDLTTDEHNPVSMTRVTILKEQTLYMAEEEARHL